MSRQSIVDKVFDWFPAITPIPTIYAVTFAMYKILGWPIWVLAIAGLILEGLGFVSADTAMKYYDFNRDTQKGESRAPAWIAYFAFGIYLLGTMILTIMYEPFAVAFPIMSLAGFLLFVLRKDQQVRERSRQGGRQLVQQEKERQRKLRQERRKQKAIEQKEKGKLPGRIGSDENLLSYLRENPGMSHSQIASHFGVTRSAVGQRINSLRKRNITWVEREESSAKNIKG